MNVEIGAEVALFPEKEYINGIFVAVRSAGPVVPSSNHSACPFINIPTLPSPLYSYSHHHPNTTNYFTLNKMCWKHELNYSTNIFIILFYLLSVQEQSMESPLYSAWLADKYSF
jgi:hypothetical protein